LQVKLVDTKDLKAVVQALKQVEDGKEIRKQLSRELREVARPLVPKVRQAWQSAPSMQGPGRGQPDLRVLLAKATRSQVRLSGKEAGVLIRTDGRKMPSGMRALPGYAEGIRRRRWRHPVYGNQSTWVEQRPFPRFYQAVQPDEEAARRACLAAVDRAFDKVRRAQ
jgi:hypothetical protein